MVEDGGYRPNYCKILVIHIACYKILHNYAVLHSRQINPLMDRIFVDLFCSAIYCSPPIGG